MPRLSLETKLVLLLLALAVIVAVLTAWFAIWLHNPWLGALLAFAVCAIPLVWAGHAALRPIRSLFRALDSTVASYRDGDFSISLRNDRHDELARLIDVHNELAFALRDQHQDLMQRELLLDTLVQQSPVALVLTDRNRHIAYANLAARHLFNHGKSAVGLDFDTVLARGPPAMQQALTVNEDSLFSVPANGEDEYFHLSRRSFRLRGKMYELYLVQHVTREMSRQEVVIWKRVIRVISHELNNSLSPISSLAYSGAEFASRGDFMEVPELFTAIGERAHRLHAFINGYAKFAKLPKPNLTPVAWQDLLASLQRQCSFRIEGDVPAQRAYVDRGQIEQVLINLVKNAHESGSAPDQVALAVRRKGAAWRIDVEDRGPGMSEAVLSQALLPFYSTKRSGTGLGLALAREIVEAHDGHVRLANRTGGGLRVTVLLPAGPARTIP